MCALLQHLKSASSKEVVKVYPVQSLLRVSSVCPVSAELFIGRGERKSIIAR